ncbi:hypothetical protein [Nannocystis pusilla]|uniref:hypothetical protein n=1 Tax=Nannocystis pusilla TaxID=889268 RepID=UPI003B827EC6
MTEVHELGYRGKHYTVPGLADVGVRIEPDPKASLAALPEDSPILHKIGTIWDLENFKVARRPVELGQVPETERAALARPGMPRTLDMPIKFPGSDFRLPAELAQLRWLVQRVADLELAVNPRHYDEFYCYLTVDQGPVRGGVLQREAPCHVDGFQGARWQPKVRINHTYTVTDCLPTAYYVQPFDFTGLDEARHNFFFEMNNQVARTRSAHAWHAAPWELTLMDAYTVHRGAAAEVDTYRTWIRLSFEVRIFDRLGNAHNPMFRYAWDMVPRDIEGLGLVAWDPDSDPSLRVFPWQDERGEPHPDRHTRTQPRLKP